MTRSLTEKTLPIRACALMGLFGISFRFQKLFQSGGYVRHVLLTLLPLYSLTQSLRRDPLSAFALDLHA